MPHVVMAFIYCIEVKPPHLESHMSRLFLLKLGNGVTLGCRAISLGEDA